MYWNISDEERLVQAFMLSQTPEVTRKFLDDILTPREKETLTRRLKAACLIKEGASYKQIEEITGLSSATIAWIAKKIGNKKGGFRAILRKFTAEHPAYFD